MKVDFDNMRVQMVEDFNRMVSGLNAHIGIDENTGVLRLSMSSEELRVLAVPLNDLRMKIVCFAWMSGENETFSEVGTDDMKFLSLKIEDEEVSNG